MGTSVEMLEKFYGQTVTSTLAAEVSKSGRWRESGDSEKQYPFERNLKPQHIATHPMRIFILLLALSHPSIDPA